MKSYASSRILSLERLRESTVSVMRFGAAALWIATLSFPAGAVEHPLADSKSPSVELGPPDPVDNPESARMLDLPGTGTDPAQIDFDNLPTLESEHAVISDVRKQGGDRVNQHAYLTYCEDQFWAMWSDGPGVSRGYDKVPGHDRADQRVSFATSPDGLHWSVPRDLSGPPRQGFGYIARGFWQRGDRLLALASHYRAPGYDGEGLSLEAFRWNRQAGCWAAAGTIRDDSLNNFPPKKLPSGEWMMSRRDHRRQVSCLVGGVEAMDQWQVLHVATYSDTGQKPEEPYWYVLPDGKHLVGLFRDNGGSKRLLRAFSVDNGRSWSKLVPTNFPDATSKFNVLRSSRGYYVLVSNANPACRDPLTLAVSRDGLVFTRMARLVGGRHVDYPHVVERDGHLLVAFSGVKQTVEVLKIPLSAVDRLLQDGSTSERQMGESE